MNPVISIQIDSVQKYFRPGQTLSGTYAFVDVSQEKMDHAELSVLWFTEGKGDEDMGVHFFESIPWGEVKKRNFAPGGAFNVVLPMAPLSYYGKVLKIHWEVRVRLFLKDGSSFGESKQFTLGDVPPVYVVLN